MAFLQEAEFDPSVVQDVGDPSVLELFILVLALAKRDLFGLADSIFEPL